MKTEMTERVIPLERRGQGWRPIVCVSCIMPLIYERMILINKPPVRSTGGLFYPLMITLSL